MEEVMWNPWHGCHKISEGCKNCYMYQHDSVYGVDSSKINKVKTKYELPLKVNRQKEYKIESGSVVATCFTSDFFIEEADEWRKDIWGIIKKRKDLIFFIVTKRIDRFMECIPDDWEDGYDNVFINVTAENQKRADERIPILLNLPIKRKGIIIAPILEAINISTYLETGKIDQVSIGGESGRNSRVCNHDWIMSIRNQCLDTNVNFLFHQTGSRYRKDGKTYYISKDKEKEQASKAGLDYIIK